MRATTTTSARAWEATHSTPYTYAYAYTYDDADNPYTVAVDYVTGSNPPSKTFTYAYWPNGLRQTMTLGGLGDFDYTYDAVGRMTELTNPSSETSYWTYQTNGLLSRQTLGNGAYAQHYYNARGLLTRLLNEYNGSARAQFAGPSGYYSDMTYDAAGNRLQYQALYYSPYSGTVTYTYDTKDRLDYENSTRNGGYTHDPAYDDAFNPTTFRGTSGLTYNDDNQRSSNTYDGNGNPTTYAGTTLVFDAENRMTQHGTALYAGYSGDGLRAWKDTDSNADVRTYFLYDGGVLLAEMDASGTLTAANTWGANGLLSRRVSSTTTYYAYDPQGSVAARLNSAGTTVSTDLYDAYGSLLAGGASDPYGYCGQWGYYRDSETGKTLCTHRYYDPNAGRWLTRDPIGYRGGVNLYGYAAQQPVTRIDATGRKSVFQTAMDAITDALTGVDPDTLDPQERRCRDQLIQQAEKCYKDYRDCKKRWWAKALRLIFTDACAGPAAICLDHALADFYDCSIECLTGPE